MDRLLEKRVLNCMLKFVAYMWMNVTQHIYSSNSQFLETLFLVFFNKQNHTVQHKQASTSIRAHAYVQQKIM